MMPAFNVRGLDGPMLMRRPRFAPREAAAAPLTPNALPADLPSGWFVVPAIEGEVGRMWVQTGEIDSNYVWGESPRTVVGTAYRNHTHVLADSTRINALRLPGATTIRLHVSQGFLSTHIAANDGGDDEPNRSLYIYTSASAHEEFRYDGITNAGGGFVNWPLNTGHKVALRATLATANTRVILVVAPASEA